MKLHSDSFKHNGMIPTEFAFAQVDAKTHVRLSSNKNPHLMWVDVPAGTQSFVLTCVDVSAPSSRADANLVDREISAELDRVDFTHWVLINMPLDMTEIAAGQFSNSVVPKGKSGPLVAGLRESPLRQGINDYTHWFAGDHDMEGDYYGYDGPCPPWNDSLVHEYFFTIHALDVVALEMPLDGKLNINTVLRRMDGHVLSSASLTGFYTLTPRLLTSLL